MLNKNEIIIIEAIIIESKVQRQPNVQKKSLNHSRFGYYFLFLHCRDIRKIKNLEILEDLCVHWVAVVPKE